jgi:dihydropteroate synthase
MRSVFDWNIGTRTLQLGKRTLVMGVLNVTPDSFSDGGKFLDRDLAVEHAMELLQDGADIIDIGGESTRPGAKTSDSTVENPIQPGAVSEKEELERVIPVIKLLKQMEANALISIDTYKANVARAAVEAGAEIVNDISALRWDPAMRKTVAELKCGTILMHMRGKPEEWRTLPPPPDIVTQVKRELREWADAGMMAGIKRERMVLDPGFGFGKNFEENYPMLKRFEEFHEMRYPLLIGVSRKSFLGRALARNGRDATLSERLLGTVAAETTAVLKGAHIIRTHDVRACTDAMRIADLAS